MDQQWVIIESEKSLISSPEPAAESEQVASSTVDGSDSVVSIVSLNDSNSLLFSTEIVGHEGNVVGAVQVESTTSYIADPVMPNIMTDHETASVLVALNDSSAELSVRETETLCQGGSWSEFLNPELERLFSIDVVTNQLKTAPKKETKTLFKKLTSHRILTSSEILEEK